MASHVFQHLSHDESLILISKMISNLKEDMPELKKIISGSDEQRKNKINELLMSIAEEYDLTADIVVPGEAFRRAQNRQRRNVELDDVEAFRRVSKRQRNDTELEDVEFVSQQSQQTRRSTRSRARRSLLLSPEPQDATEHQEYDSLSDDSLDSQELKGHPNHPDLWKHHFYAILPRKKPMPFVSEANNKEPAFKAAMIVARQGRIATKRCDHCVKRGTFCLIKDGYTGCSQCLFRQHGGRCTLFHK